MCRARADPTAPTRSEVQWFVLASERSMAHPSRRLAAIALVASLVACGGSPPPEPLHPEEPEAPVAEPAAAPVETVDTPQGAAQPPPPLSTASYDEALAVP